MKEKSICLIKPHYQAWKHASLVVIETIYPDGMFWAVEISTNVSFLCENNEYVIKVVKE